MNFDQELQHKTKQTEEILLRFLPKEQGYEKTVIQAMNYSILAGGKRLRPVLMQECFQLFHGQGNRIYPFMAAIEMIHNYSLVHDDLPAMDNDEYRRGRKTTWTVYGDGMAVLAGDGLLNLAYETAMLAFSENGDDNSYRQTAKALCILANKAGISGMIGGQSADVEAEKASELTQEQLLYIHEHKTAALIQAAMTIGAVLAGANEKDVERIDKVAYNVGVAFQIQDDILDITSTTEVLGKPVGSDEKNHKLTYVTLNGLEQSKAQVKELSEEAVEIIRSYGSQGDFLVELIERLINREK